MNQNVIWKQPDWWAGRRVTPRSSFWTSHAEFLSQTQSIMRRDRGPLTKQETTTKCAQTQEWVHSTNATLQINAQPTQPPTFSSLITAHQSVICLHRDRKMCSDDSIYVRHTDLIQQVRLYLVLTWELFYTEYRNVHQGWETWSMIQSTWIMCDRQT